MKNDSDSPFGSPRFMAALAITFIALWGWQYYMNKVYPAKTLPSSNSLIKSGGNPINQEALVDSTKIEKNIPQAGQLTLNESTALYAKTINFSNETTQFLISSIGMGLSQHTMKNYKDKKGVEITQSPQLPLFSVAFKNNPINFTIIQRSQNEFFGEAIIEGKKITRSLVYDEKTFSFLSEINFEQGLESLQLYIEQDKAITSSGNFFMPSFDQQDFIFVKNGKTESESITAIKDGEGIIKSADSIELAGVTSQYFATAILNKSEVLPSIIKKVDGKKIFLITNYDLKNLNLTSLKQTLYVGAKKTEVLTAIDSKFEELLNYGIFGFISKPLLKLLKLMFSVFGNWGLAIIGMTLIVRGLLLPFNIVSFRSAQAMQKIKPQMDAVREKYKNDPMKLNKETMALMKEHKANPISGCLPMLIQIPIFFALWKAISSSVELYQQPFFGWITDLSTHDHFFVLPVLMGITMYLQQKLTPSTMDPMQAKILAFMPIVFSLFMITLPSGLTLYNFISALFGVVQQYFLLRKTNTAT